MLVSGPPLNKERDKSERRDDPTNVFNNQHNNNRQPRFENSVTPPGYDDDYQSGSPSVIASARLGEQTTDTEQYREYLYRNHSNNEARALYARMLVSRNYNYQSSRLKDNLAAVSNTSTSEDEILDPQQQPPNTSTPAEALAEIPANETLAQSTHFPKVDPNDFLDQLRARVSEGGHEGTNQGAGTNFCWAAAIAKHAYDKDPKGMVDAMMGLYENGTFVYDNNNGGMNVPEASQAARDAVGSDVFDNNQDEQMGQAINEPDQMLFMTLADHYKGYTNVDLNYDPGNEEGLWAGGVLNKAVDVWNDFGFDVEVTGSDLGWSSTGENKMNAVTEAMETNDVVLYVNSGKFKRDEGLNAHATHYIHVKSIEQIGNEYRITYWDYGKEQKPVTMDATQFFWAVYGMIEIPKAMINILNRKIMILGMLMSMMVLTSCDSSQCMKDYYTTNQDSLAQIRTLSQTLADNYAFLKITIRKKRGQLELGFDGEIGAASMYLNPTDLSLIHEFPNSKCSPEELQRFRTMYQDDDLREILNLFEAIEPKAIRISHGGIFVALGQTLESPNPNLEGGILMTFEPELNNSRVVEQIDTNVYLYDDLVY